MIGRWTANSGTIGYKYWEGKDLNHAKEEETRNQMFELSVF